MIILSGFIPFFGALLSFMVPSQRWSKRICLACSCAAFLGWVFSPETGGYAQFSLLMMGMTSVVFPLVMVFCWQIPIPKSNQFWGWFLCLQANLLMFFSQKNFFVFFVSWELTLVPILFLMAKWGGKDRYNALFKYVLTALIIGLLLLLLFVPTLFSIRYGAVVTFLLILPFLIKTPVFPLNFWQLPLYLNAPIPLLMVAASVMSKMGLFGVYHYFELIQFASLVSLQGLCEPVIYALIVSAGIALCLALVQKRFMSYIAYISMAHLTLFLIGFFVRDALGIQASVFLAVGHTLSSLGLVGVAVIVERSLGNNWHVFKGIREGNPFLNMCFIVFSLCNMAFPMTYALQGRCSCIGLCGRVCQGFLQGLFF